MPDQLHEQLIELLGKPRTSELLSMLSSDLGGPPVEFDSATGCLYDFDQTGVHLEFNKMLGYFNFLVFSIFTVSIQAGETKQYPGILPFGITVQDSAQDIAKKLPKSSTIREETRFQVDLAPLKIEIHLDGLANMGNRRLSIISVLYEPSYMSRNE